MWWLQMSQISPFRSLMSHISGKSATRQQRQVNFDANHVQNVFMNFRS